MSDAAILRARQAGALDLNDLRQRALPPLAFVLMVTGGFGAWCYMPGETYYWRQIYPLLGLMAVAGVALFLARPRPLLAALLLLAGEYALAAVACLLFPTIGGLLLFVPIATSAAVIVPWASLVATVLSGAILYAVQTGVAPQPYFALSIAGYCACGAALCASGEAVQHTLLWAWRRHGDALELAEQLRDRQGELNRTIKALDLAYRLLQRTNHELAEARQEAEEARRLKEQFAVSIAHELRTPLNVILGFSEMMHLTPEVYGEATWTPQARRDIAQIYTASRHLRQLVDDVLDLSQLNSERASLRKSLVDVGHLMHEVVDTARQLVRDRPLHLSVELDPAVPPMLLDATRMRQALFNLVNNAIRFTDEGEVTVCSRRRDDGVLLTVSDTGEGIPEGELESIFDEFYQAEGSSARPGKGIGLGLAIAKRFVRMHGGRIWAESPATEGGAEAAGARHGGRGSTFSVWLPLGGNTVVRSRLRTSTPARLPGNPYAETVVLLGGGRDLARLLEHHMGSGSESYQVLLAAGAEQARRLASEHHARAVVCNLSLAGLRSLAAEFMPASLPCHTPLVWTAIPCAAWRAEALGVFASLQKPVERTELLGLLRGLPGARDVLIVDDDLPFSLVVTRMLETAREGGRSYEVRAAYGGAEGLEEMRRRRPDVVLLDLLMPPPDGPTVLAAMRADPALRDVPVVVVTAGDAEEVPEVPEVGLVALAQSHGWGLSSSLRAVGALIGLARAEYSQAATAAETA